MPEETANFASPSEPGGHTQVQSGGPPVAPPGRPPSSGRIGKYEIVDELGEGGMGRVYKAFDPELKRHVAVKVLKPGTGIDDVVRFRGEAELVACLEHANIVKVHDIGMDQSQPYLVLEYVDGGSLADQLRKHLPRPREAAEKIETLARAVHEAHRKGIVHRDLKPANVLVTQAGTLKVSDFGLGKRLEDTSGRTRTGDVFGTPNYMAPEQASGDVKATGPTTDVYALGTILYEMLTGRPPFAGAKVWDVLAQVQYVEPAAPSLLVPRLPRDLSTICLKCLEKAPKARYASALELADDLRRWLNNEPIVARPTPWWERLWRRARRRPKEAAIAAAVLVAGVATAGFVVVRQDQANAARQSREDQQRQQERHDDEIRWADTRRNELQARNTESLKAINRIRDLALHGELDANAQNELRKALADYYTDLNDRSKRDKTAPETLAHDTATLAQLIVQSGERERAVKHYDEAERLYREVPDDTNARGNLAETLLKSGELARQLGRYPEARRKLDEAGQIFKAVRAAAPADLPALNGLAEVYHQLGELEADTNGYEAARGHFGESIRFREEICRAAPDNPAYAQDLARGFGYRGDVHAELGWGPDADRDFWQSHKIRERVVRQLTAKFGDAPHTEALQEARFQLARSWGNLAGHQTRNRSYDTALYFWDNSYQIRKDLVAARGSVTLYHTDLAHNCAKLGELFLLTGKVGAAGERLREALQEYEGARERTRNVVSLSRELGDCYLLMARLRLREGDPAQAVAYADKAWERYAPAAGGKDPGSGDCYAIATIYGVRAQRPGGSAADAAEAVEWLGRAVQKGYRDKHPEDVRQDAAFQGIKETPQFPPLVDKLAGRAARPSR